MMMQIASIAMTSLMMVGTPENPCQEFYAGNPNAAETPVMETAPEVYATETGILLNFPNGTGYYVEF